MRSKRKAFAVIVALVMVISLFSPIKLNHLELSAEGEVVDAVVDATETKNEEETDEKSVSFLIVVGKVNHWLCQWGEKSL